MRVWKVKNMEINNGITKITIFFFLLVQLLDFNRLVRIFSHIYNTDSLPHTFVLFPKL